MRPSNHIARNASADVLKLEDELECQVCLGDGQIQTKCFLTGQPGLDHLTLDWQDELGLLKRIISTIAEDKLPSAAANLTERAERKSALGRNRQKDPSETITQIEAKNEGRFRPE